MTDLETMVAMLERAAIEYEREVLDPGSPRRAGCTMLSVHRGYSGFVSDLYFSHENGSLVSIEAYE